MDKVFCVHCGYVFGKEGDGGQDAVSIMLEAEKNFPRCPKCASSLELSIGDDPASTSGFMQDVNKGRIRVIPLEKQNRQYPFGGSRPGQSTRPSILFMITVIVALVALLEILPRQPWWTSTSKGLQIVIELGGLLIAVALAFVIDRLFRRRS
jgi:hypothetical protein